MEFMNCTACKKLVQVNPTGICMGCQMGFSGPQADSWENCQKKKVNRKKVKKAEAEEEKYADEVPGAT